MRVTYLTGQAPASVDLGPVILPGAGGGAEYDDTVLVAQIAAQQAQIEALQQAIEEILEGGSGLSPVAPELTDGSLEVSDGDLIITPPTVTAGIPTPTVEFTLIRGGANVLSEVADGRITNAAAGEYTATWTAANGIGSPAVVTRTATVVAANPIHAFILAGQSNMAGTAPYENGGRYPAGSVQYTQAGTIIDASTSAELDFADPTLSNGERFGVSLQFARDYAAANPGVTVALIPCAVGNTGFVDNRWNPGDDRFAATVARTNAFFALEPTAQLRGFIWHQGESDSADIDAANAYTSRFNAMIAAMRAQIPRFTATVPVVVGGFSNAVARPYINTIRESSADVPNRLLYSDYANADDLGLQDSVHFTAPGYRTLGSRYYLALEAAKLNDELPSAAPGQVTGLTAAPGDGQVSLNWNAVVATPAVTGYQIERRTTGSYSTLVASQTATTYVDLTAANGTAYTYRATAINSVSTGTPSAEVSATPTAAAPAITPETGATAHYVFGTDNPNDTDLNGTNALLSDPPARGTNFISSGQGVNLGLATPIVDAALFTMCVVMKKNANFTGQGIYFGSLTDTASAPANSGWGVVEISNQVTMISRTPSNDAAGVGSAQITTTAWQFMAMTIGTTEKAYFLGRSSESVYIPDPAPRNTDTLGTVGLGSLRFEGFPSGYDYAEVILFKDQKLTQAQLQAVYLRTVSRMSARGIALP